MFVKNKKRVILTVILLAELVAILLVILLHIAQRGKADVVEFTSDMLSIAGEDEGNLTVIEGTGSIDPAFMFKNRRIVSPTFFLTEGIYQVDVFYQSTTPSGSTTGCHIYSDSQDNRWLKSESVMLKEYDDHINYRMYLNRNNIPITVRAVMEDDIYDTVSISRIAITALDGRSLVVALVKLLMFFAMTDGFILLMLYRREILSAVPARTICVIAGLMGILFLAELPMTMNYLPKGYDLRFHYYKIYSIARGLQEGMFPVKIQPEWVNGYGYATGVFYGDIFLYLPAALYLLGFSLSTSYKCYVFGINFLTVFNSFFCFKTVGKHSYWGLAGAAVYTMSLHRLVAAYTRGALGAFSAMAFLPLIILGLWKIYCGNEKKFSGGGYVCLGLGMTGVLESHVLGTLMSGAFIVLFALICWRKTFTKRTIFALVKAALLTVLLNLFFIVPFLHLYLVTPLRVQTGHRSIYEYTAFVSQLFTSTFNSVGDVREDLVGMYHDMPMSLGPAALILLFGCALSLFLCTDRKAAKILRKPLLLVGLSLWFSTDLFPYRWLEAYCPAVFYIFMKFEFAWRFEAIAAALCPLLFVLLFSMLREWFSHEKIVLVSAVLAFMFIYQGAEYIFQYNDGMIPFEYEWSFKDLSVSAVYDGQYLPEGFDETNVNHRITLSNPQGMELEVLGKGLLSYCAYIKNETDEEVFAEFPLLLYEGYHARNNTEELQIVLGDNQRLRIIIPARFEGNVEIGFTEPWFWRLSEIVSVLTLLSLLFYAGWKSVFLFHRKIMSFCKLNLCR